MAVYAWKGRSGEKGLIRNYQNFSELRIEQVKARIGQEKKD